MSRSTTAMLLSAFVMPGAGQFYLKRVLRGMVLIVVSVVCLWIIGESVLQQATTVLNTLQSGDTVIDPNHIAELVAQTREVHARPARRCRKALRPLRTDPASTSCRHLGRLQDGTLRCNSISMRLRSVIYL